MSESANNLTTCTNENLKLYSINACLLNIHSLTILKTNYVLDLLNSNNVDILALTEIWGDDRVKTIRALATPPGYSFFHSCRDNKRGGGVGIIM